MRPGTLQHSLPFTATAGRRPASDRVPGSRPDLLHGNGLGEVNAADITRGAVRLLDGLGLRTLIEMRLASGRRVDAIGLDGRGRFAIVEVKSGLADLRADAKWPDYLPYCDQFYFAVAPGFPVATVPEETGVIVADRYGGEVARPSPLVPMASATRRRQTLLFAHVASARLFSLTETGLY
jgi:hypothetical protein